MNAVNPVPSQISSGAGGAEPSMEEILASIRRIIADDGAPARLTDDREPASHEAEAHRIETHATEAHEMDQRAAEPDRFADAHPRHLPPEVAHALEPLSAEPDLQLHRHETGAASEQGVAAPHASSEEGPMAETSADLPPHPLAPAPEVMGLGSVVRDEPVLGRQVPHDDAPASETPHAPERLFASAVDSSVTAAFNTLAASRFVDNSEQLSGLVQEMIRPLVKAWVDEHLPSMVERLVVAEIERMARG